MQVALHFGAPFTDENRIQLCLGKNRDRLSESGTVIPRPSSYRKNLRSILKRFKDGTGDDALRAEFLQTVAGTLTPNRLIFSTDAFLGVPRMSVREDQFYPGHTFRLDSFLQLFDGAEVELFFAICNPVTYLHSLMRAYPGEDVASLIEYSDPMLLRWSDFIAGLRETYPQLPITVWCNEDCPLIWSEILQSIAGVEPDFELIGAYSFLEELMDPDGFKRFQEYLKQRPNITADQKSRVASAFLEKFAREDLLEEDIDYPGWTEADVETLTNLYDADLVTIQNIPNITVLQP
ncbi:MAG: hypothetical protein JXQ85_14080 [Cognatishimia sp.]|uniref:hypothetical protein n=1 Tax=Cognatishimia sp. TaxID=2211648 RepID=UPI003B8D4AE1